MKLFYILFIPPWAEWGTGWVSSWATWGKPVFQGLRASVSWPGQRWGIRALCIQCNTDRPWGSKRLSLFQVQQFSGHSSPTVPASLREQGNVWNGVRYSLNKYVRKCHSPMFFSLNILQLEIVYSYVMSSLWLQNWICVYK